jgi:histidinol-phosphate aminotransferase
MRTLGAASVAATAFPGLAAVPNGPLPPRPQGPNAIGIGPIEMDSDIVTISMNENPLGPAPAAVEAVRAVAGVANRYHHEFTQQAVNTIIDQFVMKHGYVGLFPGSAGALNLALLSNIGPGKPLVYGDPSYEMVTDTASFVNAPTFAVKLTPAYAHDVRAMVKATPNAGAYYIVNPNNPTGTLTPKADIEWLLQHKSPGSVVIVDEAYHSFSNADSCIDLVAADKDIIVTRTFSKLYGMAGLRAGIVFAKPELLAKFSKTDPAARSLASISITTAAAVNAVLLDQEIVPTRRKINADNRDATLEFLTKHGYTIVPGSQANFFMVDTKRPGRVFSQQMAAEGVIIGRTWQSMPTYVRVTVGTADEMAKFQTAFVRCMDKDPSDALNGPAALHIPELFPNELHRSGSPFA